MVTKSLSLRINLVVKISLIKDSAISKKTKARREFNLLLGTMELKVVVKEKAQIGEMALRMMIAKIITMEVVKLEIVILNSQLTACEVVNKVTVAITLMG